MASSIHRWNGTAFVDVQINTDAIEDGAVTAVKLDTAYLPLAGGALVGATTVQIAHATNEAFSVLASTDGTSERARIKLGDWSLLQDSAASGTKDFQIDNGTLAVQISTARLVGVGVAPETGYTLKVNGATKVVTGSGSTDEGLVVTASSHVTSERAAVTTGSWSLGQDSDASGTKDFYIKDGSTSRLLIDTSGRIGIGASPDASFQVNVAGNLQITAPGSGGGGVRFNVIGTGNPGIEIRSTDGGTPFIDWSNDSGTDYDMRLILSSNDVLNVDGGALQIGGNTALHGGIVKFGKSTVTLNSSGKGTIAHGLGATPTAAFTVPAAEYSSSGSGDPATSVIVYTVDSTNLSVKAWEADGTTIASVTLDIFWIAFA